MKYIKGLNGNGDYEFVRKVMRDGVRRLLGVRLVRTV